MKIHLALLFLTSVAFFEVKAQTNYTFVFLHKRNDAPSLSREENENIMKGHMGNMSRLAKEGKLLAAGPFDGGGGIFVFIKASQSELDQWLSGDPGIQAKRWNLEVLSYEPFTGGICPVKEPYEMVSYTFVHFKSKIFKFNVQEAGKTVKAHKDFVKNLAAAGNVVTAALFGEADGGIVVMKGDVAQDVFNTDPAVSGALFDVEYRKLYIAKGSFCEK